MYKSFNKKTVALRILSLEPILNVIFSGPHICKKEKISILWTIWGFCRTIQIVVVMLCVKLNLLRLF